MLLQEWAAECEVPGEGADISLDDIEAEIAGLVGGACWPGTRACQPMRCIRPAAARGVAAGEFRRLAALTINCTAGARRARERRCCGAFPREGGPAD